MLASAAILALISGPTISADAADVDNPTRPNIAGHNTSEYASGGGFRSAVNATQTIDDFGPYNIRTIRLYFDRTSEGLAKCHARRIANAVQWTAQGWRHGTSVSCFDTGTAYHLVQWFEVKVD